ncbi:MULTISPECIES: hypothetical protein [unclassified Rhodococcus (in: high G+C Gram-positive bacteria)]|uniref:hypothetical protein n=1 Tax=unclassified Rhodococcus (in: high G+C Gram-positive bacteria) TaxID=192944 RepID=UPI00163AAD7F|nr:MULTISPECIES: hypothetical protein [unclassified Rhodococcus (in: high G+C Gram-positive bacteria)]MBC2642836.1 hypothetical protein [Rhodococcus sp. 3A]MBC2892422.1 hypothetical protein [Rhodococcus sp. 4CII]
MASSTRSPDGRRAEPERIPSSGGTGSTVLEEPDPARARRGCIVAVVLGLVGGLGVASAPVLQAVRSVDGTAAPSGIGSAALCAAVFAVAAPVIAVLAVVARRTAVAGAVLAGAGAVSIGAAVLDTQLWTDAIDANRLELFRPATAAELAAGSGAYAALAGHVLVAAAGLLGMVTVHRMSLTDGYGDARSSEQVGRATGARVGFLPSAVAVAAAVVLVGALFAPAFVSEDPVVLVQTVVESDLAASAGAGLVAAAILIVVASALASISPPVASGALVGAGLCALGVVGTRLVAGLAAGERIQPGPGAVWGTVGAGVLVVVGFFLPMIDRARDARIAKTLAATSPSAPAPGVPGKAGAVTPSAKGVAKAALRAEAAAARARIARWHVAAGIAGIVTTVLAAAGALLPVLDTPAGIARPDVYATRVVLVAALVLVVGCVWLLLSEFASAVRPAVGVLWVTIPFSVAAVSQSVVLATDVPGIGAGVGAVLLWGAAVTAGITGVLTWFAGSAEREEIDTSEEPSTSIAVLAVGGLGAVAAVAGLGLPLFHGTDARGDEYAPASFAEVPWNLDVWGRVLLGVAVVLAVIVASRSRPARAVALLVGSAVAVGVYVLSWPLTAARVTNPAVGAGVVPATVGIVLITAAAALTTRSRNR